MKKILKPFLVSFFSMWISAMLLLFVIVFSGCSSTKKVEKAKVIESVASSVDSKTDQSKTESLKVTDKTEKITDKSLMQIENETNALETRITEYDTDKPIVIGTYKPPVKSETITTSKRLSQKDTEYLDNSKEKTTSDAAYTSQLEASIKLLQSENAKLVSEVSNKETTSVTWWRWFLAGMCIPVAIGLLVKFGAFSKLFVFVLKIFRVKS